MKHRSLSSPRHCLVSLELPEVANAVPKSLDVRQGASLARVSTLARSRSGSVLAPAVVVTLSTVSDWLPDTIASRCIDERLHPDSVEPSRC